MRRVLCVPALSYFDDFDMFVNKSGRYLDHLTVEKNFAYRQVIPYCVIFDPITKKFLVYQRPNHRGDERLKNQYSIGIGGHVEEQDGKGYKAVINARNRECEEEIGIIPKTVLGDIIIMLNDTEVDRVHLGFAQVITQYEGVLLRSDEVPDFEFKSLEELEKMQLETWSEYILKHIKQEWSDIFE